MNFPLSAQTFLLAGPAGVLQISTTYPTSPPANVTAILCHPHPLFGGTMDNKVVTTCMRALRDRGTKVVRFNFRGVGQSAGHFDHGQGEIQDLMAVIHWVKQVCPADTLWLLGFSFGAYVAAAGALHCPEITQLVTIAPAVHHQDYKAFLAIHIPWLVIMGENDDVVPPAEVFSWAAQMPDNVQLIRVPHADHFFHGQLIELKSLLQTALFKHGQ